VPIVVLVLLVGACQSTPATSAPANPTGPVTTGAVPTAAAPTTTTSSPESLGGTWTFETSNPRVVSATGNHVGGSVVIEGDRYIFTANDYRTDVPIEIQGTKALDCNATRCRIEGVPLFQLRLVDGQPVILSAAMLTPLGSFDDRCEWEDVPDGGIVTVVSTGTVAGVEVPTVVKFADGSAGGVGATCETGSHVVAWDVTATRQP
jgi:hypothetical protein